MDSLPSNGHNGGPTGSNHSNSTQSDAPSSVPPSHAPTGPRGSPGRPPFPPTRPKGMSDNELQHTLWHHELLNRPADPDTIESRAHKRFEQEGYRAAETASSATAAKSAPSETNANGGQAPEFFFPRQSKTSMLNKSETFHVEDPAKTSVLKRYNSAPTED